MNDVLDSPVESLLAKLQKAEERILKLERLIPICEGLVKWCEIEKVEHPPDEGEEA